MKDKLAFKTALFMILKDRAVLSYFRIHDYQNPGRDYLKWEDVEEILNWPESVLTRVWGELHLSGSDWPGLSNGSDPFCIKAVENWISAEAHTWDNVCWDNVCRRCWYGKRHGICRILSIGEEVETADNDIGYLNSFADFDSLFSSSRIRRWLEISEKLSDKIPPERYRQKLAQYYGFLRGVHHKEVIK